jgi:hypothetical protein
LINEYYSRVESDRAAGPLLGRSANSNRKKKKKVRKSGDTENGGFLEYNNMFVQQRISRPREL